jgi:hypothetical protein
MAPIFLTQCQDSLFDLFLWIPNRVFEKYPSDESIVQDEELKALLSARSKTTDIFTRQETLSEEKNGQSGVREARDSIQKKSRNRRSKGDKRRAPSELVYLRYRRLPRDERLNPIASQRVIMKRR